MILVFIGSPGAGKGTQCEQLSRHLGVPHLSTGEILRKAKQDGTPVGKKIAEVLDCGQLVSDELITGIVDERTSQPDCANGFLLDGFPRTIPQADLLGEMLKKRDKQLTGVVYLRVPKETVFERLAQRYQEMETPRPEDHPDALPTRFDVFAKKTEPLLDYYVERDLFYRVDGLGTPEKVFERVLSALSSVEKDAV